MNAGLEMFEIPQPRLRLDSKCDKINLLHRLHRDVRARSGDAGDTGTLDEADEGTRMREEQVQLKSFAIRELPTQRLAPVGAVGAVQPSGSSAAQRLTGLTRPATWGSVQRTNLHLALRQPWRAGVEMWVPAAAFPAPA